MNEESMRSVARDHHAKLLRRPSGGGMVGHIPVQNSSVPTFKTTKTSKTRNVAVITTKKSHATRRRRGSARTCSTAATACRPAARDLWAVAPHRSRGHVDAQRQQQFGGDPLLAPCPIRFSHFTDQPPQVNRQSRAPTRL
jgi:hypothetical protein